MTDAFIALHNVSFSYGSKPILKDINLSIKKGQLVAIMGGSGSGKTTLLRLISGQVKPNQGDVYVNGLHLNHISEQALRSCRENMGMLFQFGALFTDLNVFDNIAFPLLESQHFPKKDVQTRVEEKLQSVGLLGTEKLMTSELSGGMARRIALARAMVLNPEIMLYDEPFTGLDPISLGVIAQLIKTLNDALKSTAVMVTHDIHQSLRIVDYVYFMAHGRIVAEGSPAEIHASTNPWVRQFVDGTPDGPVQFAYQK
jgi:phospholipid/cholesterol/gamma-HCH transport system ATP-binding protein